MERFYECNEEHESIETYKENVWRLSCFVCFKTMTNIGGLMEGGNFKRFTYVKNY